MPGALHFRNLLLGRLVQSQVEVGEQILNALSSEEEIASAAKIGKDSRLVLDIMDDVNKGKIEFVEVNIEYPE